MTEDEVREIVAGWLSRDYHEDLDPRINLAPIVGHVAAVDAWLDQEQARIKALDDAARAAEQARVDTLPRNKRLVTLKPPDPHFLDVWRGAPLMHRTPIECWTPKVGGSVATGEWGHEITHGTVVQVTRTAGSDVFGCVCATSAIYEVTDEWQPHKWSGLTATPYEPEDTRNA